MQRTAVTVADVREAKKWLLKHGLLLTHDSRLPNVVSLITGETFTSSWWSHPLSSEVYAALQQLASDPDVTVAKLLRGKDTFVHRRLWNALSSVGAAREEWQMRRLPSSASELLRGVDAAHQVQAAGDPAKALLTRLLVAHGGQVHTDAGRHELRLCDWGAWAAANAVTRSMRPEAARAHLDKVTLAFGAPLDALPWHRRRRR